MKINRLLLAFLIILFFFGTVFYLDKLQQASPLPATVAPTAAQTVLGTSIQARTKEAGCVSEQGLPDAGCTPGQVMKDVSKDQICVSGYSKSVRNVPESEKNDVYTEYGIITHAKGEYEVDHLISLELGGSNDIGNLWPEPADPRPGFHEKDKVENYLHKLVCDGQMLLGEAQVKIAHNWKEFLPFVQN